LGIAYQAKKDTVSALNFFQLALAEDPQSIKALNWTGLLYYASKKPEMALLYLKQSVLINPGDPMVWTALGNCYFITGKLDEAANSYRKALTLSPENREARNNLQQILDQKREYE
jgi:anaphase-promoting complex subunit 8